MPPPNLMPLYQRAAGAAAMAPLAPLLGRTSAHRATLIAGGTTLGATALLAAVQSGAGARLVNGAAGVFGIGVTRAVPDDDGSTDALGNPARGGGGDAIHGPDAVTPTGEAARGSALGGWGDGGALDYETRGNPDIDVFGGI